MNRVEALFVALLSVLPPTEGAISSESPCALCRGENTVACPSCDAKGKFTDRCDSCEGRGKNPCGMKACGTVGKGLLPCPNSACEKGNMLWEDGSKEPCRLCAARGTIDCPICSDSEVPCYRCEGKRTQQRPCLDRRASGRLPCPLCRVSAESKTCAWCNGSRESPCLRCRSTGTESLVCPLCRGTDQAFCPHCAGLGKIACKNCYGTGWIRLKTWGSGKHVARAGKERHDACQGKGWQPCPVSKERRVACWMVSPSSRFTHKDGKVVADCTQCGGRKHLDCMGCAQGEFRALEISAAILRTTNHHAQEAALLGAALKKAEEYFARGAVGARSSESEVAKHELRRRETLARLQAALERAESER